jgi:anti-anti-sigma regulatory factor
VDESLPTAVPASPGDAVNEVTILVDDGSVRVTARGEFDACSLNALRSALAHGARSAADLQLEASGVRFVDAATLGVLVATRRIAQANGCAFEIVDPSLAAAARAAPHRSAPPVDHRAAGPVAPPGAARTRRGAWRSDVRLESDGAASHAGSGIGQAREAGGTVPVMDLQDVQALCALDRLGHFGQARET